MAELKDGMNGPMTLTVKFSGPKGVKSDGTGIQWKGKYAPHKDVLQWNTIFNETGNLQITVCSSEIPTQGTVYEDAWIEVSENKANPQYPFRTMFTKEDKAAKSAGGGKNFGGAKPNYTLEQEAYRDSRRDAIAAISAGLVGSDGSTKKMDIVDIRKVTAVFMADLLAAGKKAE